MKSQTTDKLNARILELQHKIDDAQVDGNFQRVADIEIAILRVEDDLNAELEIVACQPENKS